MDEANKGKESTPPPVDHGIKIVPAVKEAHAEVLTDIETLRDRLDKLEIASAEKSTPWFRSFSGLTGLLAIILSVVSIIYSASKDRSDGVEAKRKEIRENLGNILQLEKDIQDKTQLDYLDDYVNDHLPEGERFETLLDNIDNIHNEIPLKLSTQTYLHIAYAYFHFSFRNDRAFRYYEYALQVARDTYDSANVYLGRMVAYYSRGSFFNLVKARENLRLDLEQLRTTTDGRGNLFMSKDFSTAAYFESANAQPDCLKLIDSAKFYHRLIGLPGPRDNSRYFINGKINAINNDFRQHFDTIP